MIYGCPAPLEVPAAAEYAEALGISARTAVRELYAAFQIPYVSNYVTTLYRAQPEIMLSHAVAWWFRHYAASQKVAG
jgi:hypothetical protein